MTARRPLVVIGGRLNELPVGDVLDGVDTSTAGFDPVMCHFFGRVAIADTSPRYYHPTTALISGAYASVKVAGTPNSIVASIRKNGVEVGTVTLAVNNYVSSQTALEVSITVSDYLTVVITGSNSDTEDLTVYLIISTSEAVVGEVQWSTVLNKPTTFPPSSHTHTGVYEPADATILKDVDIGGSVAAQIHNHDSAYSATGHNHSGVYEPADGTILKSVAIGVSVAAQSHNHDSAYSATGHTHAYIPTSEKGANSGVATLDSGGKVPAGQLPSYVDDVLEYANLAGLPGTGVTGLIYVALDTNKTYRWSGSAYVEVSPSIGTDLGYTASTRLLTSSTGTDVTLPLMSVGEAGLVPASGGGTTFLRADGAWVTPSGAGDVAGPASATNNSLARFDGTTGKLLKDGAIIGADVQGYSANLTTWSGVAPAANVTTFLATPSSANLAAVLTDETGTGSNVFAVQPTMLGMVDTKTAPTISAGVVTINMALGAMFTVSRTATITSFTMSNVPSTGKLAAFMLEFTSDGTARAVTWTFSGVAVKWAGSTAPTLTSANAKKDSFVFYTYDGGTTWIGSVVGQNY